MKKIIFMGLVISLSALGASGDITMSGSISGEGTTATKDIALSGRAVKPVTVDSDIAAVDFGTVMLGKTATTSVELAVGGEQNFKVQLSTAPINNITVTGLEEKVTLTSSSETVAVPMTLAYTPTAAGETLNATLVVTASYTD